MQRYAQRHPCGLRPPGRSAVLSLAASARVQPPILGAQARWQMFPGWHRRHVALPRARPSAAATGLGCADRKTKRLVRPTPLRPLLRIRGDIGFCAETEISGKNTL